MRKIIALLLAAAMAFSLVIVAGATEETTKQTAQLDVKCTGVAADGVATFEVSIVAPVSGVAALQFTLEPEGMTQVDGGVSWPEATKLTDVFNLNEIDTNKKGNFGYTKDSSGVGKFIAYGGDATKEGRYLSGTTTLLTIQYQLNAESGTLTISDFKACQSGSQAIDQATAYICTAPESVTATRHTPTPSRPSTGIKGDVNGNGEVDVIDLQRLYAHLNGDNPLGENLASGDVNGNGEVDVIDLQRLYAHLNGDNTLF